KEGVAQAHAFRSKSFRKPRPCHWCHQPVHAQGSCCRVCKYVCHPACESKVSGAVELADPANTEQLLARLQNTDKARFTDTSWQIHRTWARNGDPLPLSSPSSRVIPTPLPTITPQRSDQNSIYDTITITSNNFRESVFVTMSNAVNNNAHWPLSLRRCCADWRVEAILSRGSQQ
ncbi:hypothetical protein ACJJTC_009878, partial [Scirpophaga incertulas]